MANIIYLESNPYQVRAAIEEDGSLAELFVERKGGERLVGNIYKGKVKNVLPGMQAAFVDIGLDRNAFLYAGDINYDPGDFAFGDEKEKAEEEYIPDIRSLVKVGQDIMVQVTKQPFGTKGARITTNITIPSRSLVLMPTADYLGVSRRIQREEDREKVRQNLEQIKPEGMGLIARTVSLGMSVEELKRECDEQIQTYENIQKHFTRAKAPSLIHSEDSLVFRTVRDLFTEQIDSLIVDNSDVYQAVRQSVSVMSPNLLDRVHLFHKHYDMFEYYGLENKIEKALRRKVWLKNGGYLVFDYAEALTVIDVNTGKYVGNDNLQETILNTNLQAAVEVARQIRLREISGIIVIDFIDMEDAENREKVVETLREETKKDRTRTTILGITGLGIVEMTRKKLKPSLDSVIHEPCPYCDGLGMVVSRATMVQKARKQVMKLFYETDCRAVVIKAHPANISEIESMMHGGAKLIPPVQGKAVFVLPCDNMHLEHLECEGMTLEQAENTEGATRLDND